MVVLYILGGIIGLVIVLMLLKFGQFYYGKRRMHKKYTNHYEGKVNDLGFVKHLSITPIVDYYAIDDSFKTEAGVSYLIEADDKTVLLDVGFNAKKEHPSPFLHNLKKIDVSLRDIDMLFFSHLHLDHVGGMKEQRKKQFSFSSKKVFLPDIPIFAPEDLSPSKNNPSKNAIVLSEPQKIMNGIASTGAVSRYFLLGPTKEHALAINVYGKGLVIVVGCGHQTIEKILEMAKENFEEPVYAVVGGLHFPVKDGRIMIGSVNIQGIAATENSLFKGITQNNLDHALEAMEKSDIKRIALSAHDSSDYAIEQFKLKFNDKFEVLKVGKKVVFVSE